MGSNPSWCIIFLYFLFVNYNELTKNNYIYIHIQSVQSSYDQLLANTDTLHRASNSLARAQEVSSETGNVRNI